MTGFCSAARLRWAARRSGLRPGRLPIAVSGPRGVAWMRSVSRAWVIAARDARAVRRRPHPVGYFVDAACAGSDVGGPSSGESDVEGFGTGSRCDDGEGTVDGAALR